MLTLYLYNSFEEHKQVYIIHTYFFKVFNHKRHNLLIKTLKRLWIGDPLLSWLNSYLSRLSLSLVCFQLPLLLLPVHLQLFFPLSSSYFLIILLLLFIVIPNISYLLIILKCIYELIIFLIFLFPTGPSLISIICSKFLGLYLNIYKCSVYFFYCFHSQHLFSICHT